MQVKSFVEFTAFAEDSYEGGGALRQVSNSRQASIYSFLCLLSVEKPFNNS